MNLSLTQAGAHTYYFDLPCKVGVYTPDGENVYLIDSGAHKDNAKKLLRALREKGWNLRGILNTHAHADHIGGNRYLQEQTGCAAFCSDGELGLTRHPLLQTTSLYGGFAHKDLRHKFLLAQESNPLPFSDPLFPQEIEVVPLPGHSFDMVGFRTPDDVVFIADSVCSETTLEKYGVTFYHNIAQSLQTFDKLDTLQAKLFVPAHAPAGTDIHALVALNRQKMNEVADFLCKQCKTPQTFDSLLQSVFNAYSLTMNHEQHTLVGSTVRSYLSYLYDTEKINTDFTNNILYYNTIFY